MWSWAGLALDFAWAPDAASAGAHGIDLANDALRSTPWSCRFMPYPQSIGMEAAGAAAGAAAGLLACARAAPAASVKMSANETLASAEVHMAVVPSRSERGSRDHGRCRPRGPTCKAETETPRPARHCPGVQRRQKARAPAAGVRYAGAAHHAGRSRRPAGQGRGQASPPPRAADSREVRQVGHHRPGQA